MSATRQIVLPLLCALAGFLVLQIPAASNSFLGAPDREMLGMGMKLRRNTVGGTADPVIWVRIDDQALREFSPAGEGGAAPPLTVPRRLIAEVLRYLRGIPGEKGEAPPTVVVVDVDLSWPAESKEAETELHQELQAWAADPSAPPLLLVRERLSTDRMLRPLNGERGWIASTPYDDVVQLPLPAKGAQASPRVMWASMDVSVDSASRARDVVLSRCLQTPYGVALVPSAAFLAAHARSATAQGRSLADVAQERFGEAAAACTASTTSAMEQAPETALISYHFDAAAEQAASVDGGWAGAAECGERRVLTIYPAADIAAAAGSPRAGLCGSVVVLGTQNSVSTDSYVTPYGPMPGSLVLANATRGLSQTGEMSASANQWLRWIAQILLVVIVVIGAMLVFESLAKQRKHLKMRLVERGAKPNSAQSALLLALNPVTVKWVVAIGAFWVGAVATAVGLSVGIWGVLAAPIYAAALSEAIREYTNES